MNETELRQYNAIWNESWKYFKTYAEQMPMDDATWERAIMMLPEIVNRHPEHEEFARKMILTVEKELERQDKTLRKGEKNE